MRRASHVRMCPCSCPRVCAQRDVGVLRGRGGVWRVGLLLLLVASSLWVVRRQFRKRVRLAEPHPLWVGKVTQGHPKHLTETEREAVS